MDDNRESVGRHELRLACSQLLGLKGFGRGIAPDRGLGVETTDSPAQNQTCGHSGLVVPLAWLKLSEMGQRAVPLCKIQSLDADLVDANALRFI